MGNSFSEPTFTSCILDKNYNKIESFFASRDPNDKTLPYISWQDLKLDKNACSNCIVDVATKRNDIEFVKILMRHKIAFYNRHLQDLLDAKNYDTIELVISSKCYYDDISKFMNFPARFKDRALVATMIGNIKIRTTLFKNALAYNLIVALEIIDLGINNVEKNFEYAIISNNEDILKKMISKYAINLKNSIYHIIAIDNRCSNALAILEKNNDILRRKIMDACVGKKFNVVEFLLDKVDTLSLMDSNRTTIIMHLCEHAHNDAAYALVKRLINDYGISITHKNNVDHTCLTIAHKNNDLRLFLLLNNVLKKEKSKDNKDGVAVQNDLIDF